MLLSGIVGPQGGREKVALLPHAVDRRDGGARGSCMERRKRGAGVRGIMGRESVSHTHARGVHMMSRFGAGVIDRIRIEGQGLAKDQKGQKVLRGEHAGDDICV